MRLSCVIVLLFAIAPGAATARVLDYRPIFQQCHDAQNRTRLAIRRMTVDSDSVLLAVDPATLATSLEHEQDWVCQDTDDEMQRDTRFVRAIEVSSRPAVAGASPQPTFSINAGLIRGATDGSFVTGDLCPSRRPLDRAFLQMLEAIEPKMPVALAISGQWLTKHDADFQWLREQERAGALSITWVNHSFRHPYVPGNPPASNFLLAPGVDMQAEILDTERLLIANGETPSVFFRFPGLVSDPALMEAVRREHLIVLGADGWLAKAPRLRSGAILLVHPNGNEPVGLRLFSGLLENGALTRPFRPIGEAP